MAAFARKAATVWPFRAYFAWYTSVVRGTYWNVFVGLGSSSGGASSVEVVLENDSVCLIRGFFSSGCASSVGTVEVDIRSVCFTRGSFASGGS
jgi:hypothetical protein